jgi:hypothetical protein
MRRPRERWLFPAQFGRTGRYSTDSDAMAGDAIWWLRPAGRFRGMCRLRMAVVKKYRQAVSDNLIQRHGCFEQLLLHLAGKFGPQLKGSLPQQPLKFLDRFVHLYSNQVSSSVAWR